MELLSEHSDFVEMREPYSKALERGGFRQFLKSLCWIHIYYINLYHIFLYTSVFPKTHLK